MAEERANNDSRNGQGGRRRYFRRRPQGEQSGQQPSGPARKESPPKQQSHGKGAPQARQGRLGRRRRRSGSRAGEAAAKTPPTPAESILNLADYVPPAEVYVYTHVSRPGSRDSYEFRSEHFSKVGRRLEDYHIDLSELITAEGEIRLTSPAPPPVAEEPEDEDGEAMADL